MPVDFDNFRWPDGIKESAKPHALEHVKNGTTVAINQCKERRLAIQAGGNVGLWPLMFSECFKQVWTFEPDERSLECLIDNTAHRDNIRIFAKALGAAPGHCGIKHRGLGSHQVVAGVDVEVVTIDSYRTLVCDLIQLDVEGYEMRVLLGGLETIRRCRPVIQVEMRDFTKKYGNSDREIYDLLLGEGYREFAKLPGADVVFTYDA